MPHYSLPFEIFKGVLPPLCKSTNISFMGVQDITRENLKVVWDEFSTLSWALLGPVQSECIVGIQPLLELKTLPRYCPVN